MRHTTGRRHPGRRRAWCWRAVAVGLTGTLAVGAAGCTPDGQVPPETSPGPAGPVIVTVAVYGPDPVISAYTKIAADFTAEKQNIVVNIKPYESHDRALAATRRAIAAGKGPSLFLAERSDVASLRADELISPVDELLGERHVDFGDGYARDALEAFSDDAALQCMPTQISPLVVYYNTRLVDLGRVAEPDGPEITPDRGWSMEEFARAARQAVRKGGRQTKGVYVAPDVVQVAPFVWSGGGSIVDDPDEPSRTTLSEESGREAMARLLELVRKPRLTFTAEQIARKSAIERFEDGRLGMVLGFRDLTPRLRSARHLSFDVMPMPVLDSRATAGEMAGFCLTRTDSDSVAAASAAFLAYLVSDDGMRTLARTGYVMPTNLAVTNSEAFIQPGQEPAAAKVFPDQTRRIHELPSGDEAWEEVRALLGRRLEQLFYRPVIDPLEQRLEAIDAGTERLLSPPEESESPSESESGSGS